MATDTQTFNSSGTWTKPDDAYGNVSVSIKGGGGGGGRGGLATGSRGGHGGGGGEGGGSANYSIAADQVSSISVTIGAGGSSTASGGSSSVAGSSGSGGNFGQNASLSGPGDGGSGSSGPDGSDGGTGTAVSRGAGGAGGGSGRGAGGRGGHGRQPGSSQSLGLLGVSGTGGQVTITVSTGTPPPPSADAPSITIAAVSSVDEDSSLNLSASISGGTYDSLSYAWEVVSGGGSISWNGLIALYTPPNITASQNTTVRVTVTATGTGTNAASGTSDTDSDDEVFTVFVVTPLPNADAPSITISSESSVDEDETLSLSASVSGGTYDTLTYAWTVVSGGGSISGSGLSATYNPPNVSSNRSVTVRVTVTASGTGTNAISGTTDTSTDTENFTVNVVLILPDASAPSVTIASVSSVFENDTLNLSRSVSGGTYDTLSSAWSVVSGGGSISGSGSSAIYTPPNVSSDRSVTVRVTVTASGTGTNAISGTTDTSTDTENFTVNVVLILPDASAPSVTIASVSSVFENDTLNLSRSVSGGTYDTLSSAWSVVSGGGSISGSGSSAIYTPPNVSSDRSVTVRVTVTATGTGTDAASGTSDTNSDDESFTVIADTTPNLPAAGPYTRSGAGNITRTLPAPSGGNSPFTYSATENDAHGSIVSFNSSTRQITVNIPSVPATLTVTYTVTDNDGDTDSISMQFKTVSTSVVPSAPAIPTLTPISHGLIVEWSPPSSIGSDPITSYDIQYRPGTSGLFNLVEYSGSLDYYITGLIGGQSYQVQVRATSQAGSGPWSSIATQTTLSTTVPGRPDAPTLADGANQLTVTWDPPDDDGGVAISAYDIRYRRGLGGWTTIDDAWTGGARTYTITSLSPGGTYQVQVRAVNSIGNGPWSESEEETVPAEIPGAPTITTATPGDMLVALIWNAPSSDGGAAITSYDVRYRIGSGNYTEIDPATMGLHSYTVMNLTNDSAYDFEVRAVNSAGEGPWSSAQMATPMGGTTTINIVFPESEVPVVVETPRVPGKPLIVSVTGSNHSLRVEWEDPEDTGTSVVEYYDVRVRASSLQTRPVEEIAWTLIDVASTDTDYTIRGLANNVEFDVQIRAINSTGPGLWSAIHSAIPLTTRESTLGLVKLISWNDLLWGITTNGDLYFSLDLTAWELHASLARHHTPVTDMFLFRDRTGAVVIHVMTETSLWVHEHEHERFSRLAVQWPRSAYNGRGSTVWLGDLYIPVGNAVFKYTGGQNPVLTQVGPNRDDGVSWLGTSRITKLVGTHNALLALVQNTEEGNNPEGTSHVLSYDEKGWQALWTPDDDVHEVLQDIFVETTAGDYSLWMGYGDLAVMDLPTNIVNPYRAPTTLRFAPSGYLITPWFNADEVAVRKLGLELVVEAYGLSATKTVQIEYALDYVENIWAQLATLDSADDEGRTLFDLYAAADDAGEGLIFDAIRFRFTITSDDPEASPYVAAYVMAFTKQLETKWGYQMTVDLNKPFGTKTADALSESLRTTAAKKKRVPFEYRSGLDSDRVAEYVRVERLTMAEKPGYAPGINALVFLIQS